MQHKILIIGGDHHNTLGVIESLAEKGINSYAIVVTNTTWAYVLKSKYVLKGWICKTEEEVVKCMLSNFTDKEQKTIVIATNDLTASMLDNNYAQLESLFILPNTLQKGSLAQIMSKEYMSALAREVGLNVPKTWLVDNGQIPEDIEYPCITKAISSIEGTKENIHVCWKESELSQFLSKQSHCPIIQIQKFIEKDYEFQLLGCSLGYGELIIIPGRTHIDRPNGLDNTFFLRFDKVESEYDELVSKVKDFIKQTHYQGPFSVEFLRDKNGRSYFTEMNFRNDGNAYCVTSAGTNIPYIYYLYNSNGDYKKELSNSTVNTTYLTPEFYYFKCMLAGEFGFREWYRNMKRTTCYTTYFKNDKRPFVWFLKQTLYHAVLALKRKM